MPQKKRGLRLFKGRLKDKFFLFKRIIGLMANRANKQQYQLELGAYFLKKGAGYQVGQVIKEKQIKPGLWKVKVITGLYYDFEQNQINHTATNKVIKD